MCFEERQIFLQFTITGKQHIMLTKAEIISGLLGIVKSGNITNFPKVSIIVKQHFVRQVAQAVEQVPHIQRLCPRCGCHGFDSPCGPFLRVIPPLSPPFPVYSSAVLSKK